MPKIIIQIEEKTEKMENGKTLASFGFLFGIMPSEGDSAEAMSDLQKLLPRLVMACRKVIDDTIGPPAMEEPLTFHKGLGPAPDLDATIEKYKTAADVEFPVELASED
jgi:hypothetical protein